MQHKHKHNHCLLSLLALPLAALLAACSGTEETAERGDGIGGDRAVAFSANAGWKEVEGTRSGDGSSFASGDAISLFAYHNDSSTPDFMNNQRVAYDGTAWTYSPVKYWPKNDGDQLSFYAASPYSAVENGDISVSTSADGHPTMTYDNTRADIDWMAAKSEAITYDNGKDGVPLAFSHLTARVQFRFAIDGSVNYHPVVHVLKYKVPHFRATVDFTRDGNGTFVCSLAGDGDATQLVRYVDNVEGEIVNAAGVTVPEFTAYLFPCSFPCTDDTGELGEFVISLNNIEHTCKPDKFIDIEAGKSYTVSFNVKQSGEGSTNYFITSYSLWEDGGDYEENLN